MTRSLNASNASAELLSYDGVLMMATDPHAPVGARFAQMVSEHQLLKTEAGFFEEAVAGAPVTLTAFRSSVLYPFVVVTRFDRDEALQGWRIEAQTLWSVLLPTFLVVLVIGAVAYRRQMEAAAQRGEAARLARINATVFATSSDSIVITDRHTNIMSVNAAFVRITGYAEEEVLGQNPRLLASGQQDKVFYADLWTELLQTGRWQGDVVNRRKDGSVFDAHLVISTSRDDSEQVQHFVGVITDITDRKQATGTR
jgi:PAS domain S-box-containing protein